MSLVAIRTGLQTLLTASGPYSAGEVSASDFGILQFVSTCAVIFLPGTATRIRPEALGTYNRVKMERTWDISGHLYIRHAGNSPRMLDLAWQAHDDLFNTIEKDNSLQGALGSNGGAFLSRMSFDENRAVLAHGHKWADILWGVTALEL